MSPAETAALEAGDAEAFGRAAAAQSGGPLSGDLLDATGRWALAVRHANKAFLQALIEHTARPVPERALSALATHAVNRQFSVAVLKLLEILDVDPVKWANRVATASLQMVPLDRLAARRATLMWAQEAGAEVDRGESAASRPTERTVWESLAYRDHGEGQVLDALLDAPSSVLHRESPAEQARRLDRLLFHSAQGGGHTFPPLWARRCRPPLPAPDAALRASLVSPLVSAEIGRHRDSGLDALCVLVDTPTLAFEGLVTLVATYRANHASAFTRPFDTDGTVAAAAAVAHVLTARGAHPELLLQIPEVHARWLDAAMSEEMPATGVKPLRSRL